MSIYKNAYFKITGVWILWLTFSGIVTAQNIAFTVSESTLTAANGELVGFTLKLENNSDKEVVVHPEFTYDENALQIINKYKEGFTLAPSQVLFVPVKAIISKNAEAKRATPISIQLQSTGDELIAEQNLTLQIIERKLVRLQIMSQNLIFESIGDSISIPVKLSNLGNTKQQVQVITRYFNSLDSRSFDRESFNLNAFSDTIVFINKVVDQEILAEDNFRITMRGLYADGVVFGSGFLSANSVKNKRRYTYAADELNLNAFLQTNQIRTSVQKNRDNYQYFLFANTEVDFARGTLQSNIDVNYVENNDFMLIRNTWVRYDADTFGVRAGNISGYDVINLIGRGVEGYFENKGNRYEMGGLDKSFNLINNTDIGFGKSAWAKFSHNGGWLDKGYEASVLYDEDRNTNTRSYFASSKSTIISKPNLELRAGASISNSEQLEDASVQEAGGAGELILNAKQGRFGFSSANFVSSGYFAGLRRGALNFMERITYNDGTYNFWGAFSYLKFNPKYLSGSATFLNQFANSRVDLGVNRRFEKFSLSLSPVFTSEWRKSINYSTGDIVKSTLNAKDLSLGIQYAPITSRHNFSLNLTGGVYNSSFLQEENPHFKAIFNYGFQNFRLNAYYQYNPFTVGEVISSMQLTADTNYALLSIVPSYQQSFFKNKLVVQTGMNFSKTSFTNSYIQLNGRMDLQLPKNFSVFFTTFYSDFNSNYYEVATMQFGLIKRFSKIDVTEKRYTLKVFVFRNVETPSGYLQEPAMNELVFIGNEAFRTDSKGMIEYKRLPQDSYTINIMNKKEWYAPNTQVDLHKNTEVNILMNKTGTVIGKVNYEFTDLSYEIPKELYGIPILLTDSKGATFSVRTDSAGNFRVYIPEGSYSVQLQKATLDDIIEIPDNNQLVEIKSGKIQNISFTLKIKERRVERKKF